MQFLCHTSIRRHCSISLYLEACDYVSLDYRSSTGGLCAARSRPWGWYVLYHRRRHSRRVLMKPLPTKYPILHINSSYESALGVGTGSIQRVWNWAGFNDIDILGYRWEDYVHPIDKNFSCGTSGLPYKASYHAPLTAGNVVSVNYTVPSSKDHWTFGHTRG